MYDTEFHYLVKRFHSVRRFNSGSGIQAIDPLVAAATLTKEQGRQATGSQAALQILVSCNLDCLDTAWDSSKPSLIVV